MRSTVPSQNPAATAPWLRAWGMKCVASYYISKSHTRMEPYLNPTAACWLRHPPRRGNSFWQRLALLKTSRFSGVKHCYVSGDGVLPEAALEAVNCASCRASAAVWQGCMTCCGRVQPGRRVTGYWADVDNLRRELEAEASQRSVATSDENTQSTKSSCPEGTRLKGFSRYRNRVSHVLPYAHLWVPV